MMRTKDMTTGNPYRLLTELALPLLGGNLLQQVYSIVDTMIVGRCIGTEALAAVGCTGALTWLILGFIIGLAQGFSICISQCYGRKDICGTVISVRMSMLLTLIFGIAITVFGMCAAIPLLKLLGTPKKIAGDAAVYIEIIMAGSLAAAFYNITSAVLRAFGNGMVPLISIIISTVLNIFLDILFIVTFNMGVAGAAYATVISQFVSGLFCYTAIKNIPELSDLWNVKSSAAGSRTIKVFDKEEAYTMVRLGLPVAVMNSITAIGVVVLQGAVDVLGALYVAAYTVGCKIIGLADNATVVISFALTTYVGQNIGADNLKRTRQGVKSALVISIIFTTCITAVLIMFGKPFSAVFLKKGQKTVIDAAYSYLVICGLMLWSLGFLFVFRAALQGMGNTFVPMLSGIIELAARIGIVCLLPVKMGFSRIGIAETSAWLCAMFFLGTGYFREIKQKKKVMNSL